MIKSLGILKFSIVALLLLSSVALLVVSLPGSGWKALSVQTGSMKPAINPGDLVLARSVPAPDLRVGDVITYISPKSDTQTITHRVDKVLKSPRGLHRFITKGDANPSVDPIVYQNQVVGVSQFTVPKIGFLFDWLRTWPGLIIAIYLPSLLIVALEMKKLARYYKLQAPYLANGFNLRQPKPSKARQTAKASAIASVTAMAIIVPAVHASLISTVSLTGNVISTGSSSSSNTTNNTNIDVTNNNPQSATSGNASGPGATSGNASNSSTTNTTITQHRR